MINWSTETQNNFADLGTAFMGNILNEPIFKEIEKRMDEIMLGEAKIDYDKLMMQEDSETGLYEEAGPMTLGFKKPTLNYRKIENLEHDPLFHQFITLPIFQAVCRSVYGENKDITTFRTMFMNKPAGKGTFLPWHQDRWNFLDKDPEITIYLAIDASTIENGCVKIIPKSHKLGVLNPEHTSGFLSEENVKKYCTEEKIIHQTMNKGDVYILHNKVIHGSEKNHTNFSRRALSICYMDAGTLNTRKNDLYSKNILFATSEPIMLT